MTADPKHASPRDTAPLLFIGTASIDTNATQHKLYFIAHELARRGRPVSVCVPDHPENLAFFESRQSQVQVVPVSRTGPIREMLRKHQIIRSRPWAAIHSIGVGIRTLVRHGSISPRITLLHDFDENLSSITGVSAMRRLYFRWVEGRMLNRATGLTCASAFLVNWAKQHRPWAPEASILYLPVAIGADEHVVSPSLSSAVRERFPGKKVLVYVGTISRLYQIDEIVGLAIAMKARRDDFKVLVCGDGPDLVWLKDLATKKGVRQEIHFEGRVARRDIASYLDAASALLFPFHGNRHNLARCPTKAYHYAAANRPLVTNRVGEVARLFGDSAFYYREGDAQSMADACELVLSGAQMFSHAIPFRSLTWEDRCDAYVSWLHGLRVW